MPDTALLIIDMQPALLTNAHDLDGCLSRVADLAQRARTAGVPVIYLRQRVHDLPAESADIHPGVAPRPEDTVLDKDSADSFLDTPLDDLLRERSVRRVLVTGNATDYCVDSTSRSALSHGYDLVLVADGHTTPHRPAGTEPTASQIIAHHNTIFTAIQYAGRAIEVPPAAQIHFDAPPS